jgi:hypothetical protein
VAWLDRLANCTQTVDFGALRGDDIIRASSVSGVLLPPAGRSPPGGASGLGPFGGGGAGRPGGRRLHRRMQRPAERFRHVRDRRPAHRPGTVPVGGAHPGLGAPARGAHPARKLGAERVLWADDGLVEVGASYALSVTCAGTAVTVSVDGEQFGATTSAGGGRIGLLSGIAAPA